MLAFLIGPPLLLFAAVYFGVCSSRGRSVAVPLAVIAAMTVLSAVVIGTGALQQLRWAQARPEIMAVAGYPPGRGNRSIGGWVHTRPVSMRTGTARC